MLLKSEFNRVICVVLPESIGLALGRNTRICPLYHTSGKCFISSPTIFPLGYASFSLTLYLHQKRTRFLLPAQRIVQCKTQCNLSAGRADCSLPCIGRTSPLSISTFSVISHAHCILIVVPCESRIAKTADDQRPPHLFTQSNCIHSKSSRLGKRISTSVKRPSSERTESPSPSLPHSFLHRYSPMPVDLA